ncbi:hypothetical protein PENTCL1PPCAC_21542 [Pristionchus entomophagus]|uniref:Dehydrogenase n=1 Tax=Pristionchus entomophagus TaxID=358040 RepID=A0AAV5TYW2_9BILA|nr:hypothetical protein PENTCL1PPCAC_21542 [Pristionchus entomophagus]
MPICHHYYLPSISPPSQTMTPSSVLITGANRGIGLGFVHHFLSLPDVKHVFAATREPETAEDLQKISDSRLHIIKMDVRSDESIVAAEKEVSSILGAAGLNLLINNAGVTTVYDIDAAPCRESILSVLDANVAGPIVVAQVFLPLLRAASSALNSLPVSISRAAIVNISSGRGSIQDNTSGGKIVYRTSKTALNSLTKTLSFHTTKDGILTVAILPGYVVTRMTGNKGSLTVEQSVKLMADSLEKFGEEHQGGFFGKNGEPYAY